jgi:hypothetical protein
MFEINVSLDGKHLFATHERSLKTSIDFRKLLPEIQKRFPANEGFQISVSYNPQVSYGLALNGTENIDDIIGWLGRKYKNV